MYRLLNPIIVVAEPHPDTLRRASVVSGIDSNSAVANIFDNLNEQLVNANEGAAEVTPNPTVAALQEIGEVYDAPADAEVAPAESAEVAPAESVESVADDEVIPPTDESAGESAASAESEDELMEDASDVEEAVNEADEKLRARELFLLKERQKIKKMRAKANHAKRKRKAKHLFDEVCHKIAKNKNFARFSGPWNNAFKNSRMAGDDVDQFRKEGLALIKEVQASENETTRVRKKARYKLLSLKAKFYGEALPEHPDAVEARKKAQIVAKRKATAAAKKAAKANPGGFAASPTGAAAVGGISDP